MLLPLFFVIASAFPSSSTNEFLKPPVSLEHKVASTTPSRVEQTAEAILLSSGEIPQGSLTPYETTPRVPHTIMENQKASGTWFGQRDKLTDEGVDFSITYTSNIAGNPVGGLRPGGFTYVDVFACACLFNTEKLFGWHGGYFAISALELDGNSLSRQNIGNIFGVQETYGGIQTINFNQLSYEQRFCDDKASVKLGRIVAGNEFAVSPLCFLYMNTGIDGNPQALWMDGGLPSYFDAVWGTRLKVDLPASTVARLGVYQITHLSRHGLNWNFYPNDGVMLLAQYGWNPEFFKPSAASTTSDVSQNTGTQTASQKENLSDKPSQNNGGDSTLKGFEGHYWTGGYYSTWEYPQFNSGIRSPNSYGLYWHADQTVYRPNPRNNTGLILWSDYVLCPQQNISLIPFQVNAGAIYTGLIPGRKHDNTIFGVAYGNFSTVYASVLQQVGKGNPTYELVYEFGYRISMTKFAYIQPDLQWIINPGGTGNIPNALVLGAQMGVVF